MMRMFLAALIACAAGAVCTGGACAQTCAPTQTRCPGGTCADLRVDARNCGANRDILRQRAPDNYDWSYSEWIYRGSMTAPLSLEQTLHHAFSA